MPTEIIKTIRASGGDYTTLAAWEAALPADLVTLDEQHTLVCYDDWPSGLNSAVDISGTTTDATRFIRVTVAEGHRHNGTPQTGFFLKGDKGGNGSYIYVGSPYTQLEWLDIENTRSGHSSNVALNCAWSQIYLKASNCIGKANGAPVFGAMSNSDTAATNPSYRNCLAWGGTIGFTGTYDASRTRYLAYNCVAANCTTGFNSGATRQAALINCVAYNCTTDFAGTYSAASYNNASEDATAPGTDSITGVTSAAFVDAAGGDFHLASGSALIGAGANLYSTFTTDIDGDARPSSGAWDIGFDHYVSGGGAQDLTPSLYTNTQDFYSATVTSSVTLTPSLFTNSETFYSATITQSGATQDLTPSKYDNTQTFYSHTVTQEGGTQYLVPDLFTNSLSFYSATVTTGSVNLSPSLVTNTSNFYSPVVTSGFTLIAPLVTNTNTFYSGTVSQGSAVLSPDLFTNTSVFFGHDITGGLVTVKRGGGGGSTRKQRKIIVERVDELIEELEDEIQQVPKEKSKLRKAKKLKPAIVEETQENANEWVQYFQAIADAIKDQQKANLLNKQIQEYQDSLNKALEAKEMRDLIDQELIQIKRNEEMAFLLMAAL